MAENIDIPVDADKMLFVEDFFSFLLPKNYQAVFQQFRVGPYRKFVYNAFNKTIQNAITLLLRDDEFQQVLYEFVTNVKTLNHETYLNYKKDIYQNYFPTGFDPNNFLQYCVHLTFMASCFRSYGVLDAPAIASRTIYNILKEQDMDAGGWDILNSIAERRASLEQHCMNLESPKNLTTDAEILENPADRNAPEIVDVTNENGKSNDLTGVKQGSSKDKVEKSQKRPLLEMEQTSVSEKFSKYDPEDEDTLSSSQMAQSTSDNESSFIDDLEIQDLIDLLISKIKYPDQSGSFDAQSKLDLIKRISLKHQRKFTRNDENSSASNAEPKSSHLKRYSPPSSDDEIGFSDENEDSFLSLSITSLKN